MATITHHDNYMTFAPLPTYSEHTMQSALALLLKNIDDGSGVNILFDFRGCTFSTRHISFTLKTLVRCKKTVAKVARAAALIDASQFSPSLYSFVRRMHPLPDAKFVVEIDEERAVQFVDTACLLASKE